MRISLVGAVESTQVAVSELMARNVDLQVLTLPAELGHRHSDYVDLAAAFPQVANIVHIDKISSESSVAAIRAHRPDLLLVFGWSQICPPNVIALSRLATLGSHPAALPLNRGRGVIPWTIVQGASSTAMTVFHLAEGVDDGDIAAQHHFPVAAHETARSLMDKHRDALRICLAQVLNQAESGHVQRIVQDHSAATWCARRDARDGWVDFHAPARDVDRLVRASTRPYPGAFTTYRDVVLRIWAGHDIDASHHWARPGQIIGVSSESLTVMCGDGRALVVEEWSADGDVGRPALSGQFGNRPGPVA